LRPNAENVLFLHTVAIEAFGGSERVRDPESLRAAAARPWGSSFGRDRFSTPFDIAAALAESNFAVSMAEGGMETEDIALWFEGHSRRP
jgi:hypothetical protein